MLRFYNNASATVTSGGTTAITGSESWTVTSVSGFPTSLLSGDWFHVADPVLAGEKIKVTAISGSGPYTWTVTRADEGSTVAHSANFVIQQVVTADDFYSLGQVVNVQAYGAKGDSATDDTTAIQNALLSFGTLSGWSQGEGGVVFMPPGIYKTSKPLIIPSGVTLRGTGWGSQITLITGSNCDVIQTATYNSSSQATILGVSAASITNAFWAGVRDMAIHGDSFGTTTAGYNHGINVTTNPLTSAAGSDPDFDPLFTVENVRIEACTGDAYYHAGRSGAFLKRVWAAYCNGVGFTLSFDTNLFDCLSEGNSAGGYFNHSSTVGSGCKFYNNIDNTWVSGHAYSAGNIAVSAGVMYFCILAVTSSTAPASDATHWTALSATAPQADGWDWYWDTGAGGHNWSAIESQEPSKGSFYFKGPNAGAIQVSAQSEVVNFNNGQAAYNSANPNHYAAVTLDGVSNVQVNLTSSTQSGGSGIICTTLNSPGRNVLDITSDGTESALTNGSSLPVMTVNGYPATGPFSVKAYGAKGDGTTDDTTACQAAITAAINAGGGTVFFPVGTYLLSAALTVTASGIALRGDVRADTDNDLGSVLKAKSAFAGANLVKVSQSGTPTQPLTGITVSGLTFDGNSKTGTSVNGLYFCAYNSLVTDCQFGFMSGHGFYAVGVSGATWNTYNTKVTSSISHDNGGSGFYWDTFTDDTMEQNCHSFSNAVDGSFVAGTGHFIQGCHNYGNTQNGCTILNGAGAAQITGSEFESNGHYGIELRDTSGGAYSTLITGCDFHDNGGATNNTYDDIIISSQSAHGGQATIVGCTFGGGGTNKPRYGINLPSGQSQASVIIGNTAPDGAAVFGTGFLNIGGTTNVAAGNSTGTGADFQVAVGSVDVQAAGQGIKVAEGSNAKQGTATLNGTTAVVVSNTSVTANSRIFLTIQSPGGTPASPYVSARTAGTSFSIKSTGASDTSTVAYFITEPG